MGGNGRFALPEHWTELSAARIHRQQCAGEVDTIKKACLEECGKRSVVGCEKCFPKVLDRMRARYCDAEGREWFSQRRAFLNELDVLFTDIKDHKKMDLKTIEDSIASEKEAWYRWVLRMYPRFLSTGGSGADPDELRAMLDDPVKRREELIERIWEGVGKPANWEADVDSLTEKIATVRNDAAALKQLYITFFFKDSKTGEVVENAQPYLEAYETSDTMSIEQVIDRIAQDLKASLTTEPQRDTHRSRLDELRRAKMAFEQNRLQNKSRAQASQTPAISDYLYDLPPCSVCAKPMDPKNVLSCPLCQALVQLGGRQKMTVYCSDECLDKGFNDHVDREHDCEAGDRCAQYDYEDIEMGEDATSKAVVCKDCIDQCDIREQGSVEGDGKAAVYCSIECAKPNIGRHRESKHMTSAAGYEVSNLALPLWETAEKILKEGNPGLKFSLVDAIETHQPPAPPPPAPSKTFTIDFEVSTQTEVDDNFDNLRDTHAQFMDSMFPLDGDTDLGSLEDSPLTGFPTPSSSHTHSIQSLHAKPQFNLDSAESLLASFRRMLVHYPCIVLMPEETVASLAATKPFVLLAILAAASGSRTLQGHTLYDEEFRKVLGLKFVAGGERSMNLLQGILIYCAWYPFHLRPKNRQAFQYYRMAGDLITDLELDQEPAHLGDIIPGEMSSAQLDRPRVYLAYYYAVSKYVLQETHRGQITHRSDSFMYMFKKKDLIPAWTTWADACCNILQRHAEVDGDVSLSYLARLANMTNTANNSIRDNDPQVNQQVQLVLLGLETQHREMKEVMVPHLSRSAPVKLASLFFEIFLQGGPIFYLTRINTKRPSFVDPSPTRLVRCVNNIRTLFDHLMNLDNFTCFTSVDWTKFILCVILAVCLSFPIADVPDWDHAWARSQLRFDEFLETMTEGPEDLTPASKRVDILSASRVILQVLKTKYNRRVAILTAPVLNEPLGHQGCPMFDKDMQPYLTAWDAGFDAQSVLPTPNINTEGQQPMYHDLWATMTMSWANDADTMGS
ncbi:unnamed protein product [Fusarium graminearum]|uniref:Uncharacterized protein n=1 Tax=Gibberella zeae TaxID=5518 RepID=A0A4U9EMB2_GIBZA|nr:unnamed protein product [Fusarium graminearum]CAF3477186.1 unnamed protein product [Fusarium graminearum]CAG1959822.1 unnamed protein product [Fusarium graminearum]CAG1982326.1 unnamed protein product [Fusarium graminearum]VTO84207.1 unnamed protein product [Fusarium graminearum]